jgi:hypothetical protein
MHSLHALAYFDLSPKGPAVTQIIASQYDIMEDQDRLIAVLERYRPYLPFVDEELARHQSLRQELEQHQGLSEQTLAEWRQALAQRWECEVVGQRLYQQIQSRLRDYFGSDSPHLRIIAPDNDEKARTAAELLNDLRRLEASLRLMQPRPPFVRLQLTELTQVCTNLEQALTWTQHCERQRHNAMLEQRLAYNLYEQVRKQTQRLLNEHLGEPVEPAMPKYAGDGTRAYQE